MVILRPRFRLTVMTVLVVGATIVVACLVPRSGHVSAWVMLVVEPLALVTCMNLFYFGWRVRLTEQGIEKVYFGLFRNAVQFESIHGFQFGIVGIGVDPDSLFAIGMELYDKQNRLLMRIPRKTLSSHDLTTIRDTLEKHGVSRLAPS